MLVSSRVSVCYTGSQLVASCGFGLSICYNTGIRYNTLN
jgi:hypothetical protein